MIDYQWHETNTEIVLTFTGNTNEILDALEPGGFDLSIGLDHFALDGLFDLVTERYDYTPKSVDPDDWKWLTVVIANGFINYTHTFTEIADMSHLVKIHTWSHV